MCKSEVKLSSTVMSVQTRSDNHQSPHSGIKHWETVKDAYAAWQEDHSIWKISWTMKEGDKSSQVRFLWTRPIKAMNDKEFDQILSTMSQDYRTARSLAQSAVFWYREDLESQNVSEVLRDVDFRGKYC
jgi:hypothetical protein